MKTLIILRHAHSLEKQTGQSDKLRELSREGIRGAIKIGTFLKKQNLAIDGVITSSAVRAYSTARIVADGTGFNPNQIIQLDELYMASLRSLFEFVLSVSDDFSCIVLVGHNPHLSYLAEHLSSIEIESFEPGGLAALSFDSSSWKNLTQNSGTLLHFTSPDELD
jgi:phosphohistidine phosphatase